MVTQALQKRAQSSAALPPARSPATTATHQIAPGSLRSHEAHETTVSPKKLAFGDVLNDFKAKNTDWEGTAAAACSQQSSAKAAGDRSKSSAGAAVGNQSSTDF